MAVDLTDRVAVVTGAARGIGRAVAVALARAGADVAGINICGVVDPHSGVTSPTESDLHTIVRELGGIDILVANAGTQGFQPLLEMSDEHWHTHVDVNLTGTANALRAFAPHIVERGGSSGRIIMVASTQGRHGTLNGAAYSATKWGVIGLMKSAALELGRHGVTVNCVVPGLIDTSLTRHRERYAQVLATAGKSPTGTPADEETAKHILTASSPLGAAWIEPDAVAPVVVFLASGDARMVSGATYDCTAGDSAHYTA